MRAQGPPCETDNTACEDAGINLVSLLNYEKKKHALALEMSQEALQKITV